MARRAAPVAEARLRWLMRGPDRVMAIGAGLIGRSVGLGRRSAVILLTRDDLDVSDSYLEDLVWARWRSATGHQPSMSASASRGSVIESPAGGIAVVPKDVPHEVRDAGDGLLRFVAVYASPAVVTRYQQEVRPDGSRERRTVA